MTDTSKPRRRFPLKALLISVFVLALGAFALYRFVLHATPVEVARVEDGVIVEETKGPGVVSSRTEVDVSSRIAGVVERVLVQEGDLVTKGQLLVALDERDLTAKASASRASVAVAVQNVAVAVAALQKARADLSLARSNFKRDEEVFRAGHISQAAFDTTTAAVRVAESAVNTARATVAARQEDARRAGDESSYSDTISTYAQITSPITGLVTKRRVEIGNTVAPGNTLFRVVDDQTVCVSTRIDVSQIGRIQEGHRARIRLASGANAAGAVVRISHESDPVTRDQEVRVKLDTPPAHLTINEEAEVVINVGEVRGLVVPGSAVIPVDGVDGVLVMRDGHAERVAVKVGAVGQGKVLILSGLSSGDQVIVHPEHIKPGQRVAATAGKD